ncbi:unnamed protein product [Lactuca saligna]|uniref:Uncharacterized protein n=1 Tax=Lactuca saligna TaxID=75948 RepID=A0AA35VBI9_LACSI|nr:unnamed protein product [Lactuca saligna]
MQFPEVRKSGDTLDMKSLELDETPVSYESSEPTSSEKTSTEGSTPANFVIDVTEDDEDSPAQRDQSTSSHEHESNERQDEREIGTGDDGRDSFEDLDLTGFDDDDIAASLASSANVVSNEIFDTIFQNVDDSVLPSTEMRKSSETLTPTSEQMVSTSIPMEVVVGCSPLVSISPTSEPSVSIIPPQADQPQSKRRRLDERQSELITSLVSGLPTPPITTATTRLSVTKMFATGPSSVFDVGGPSAPPGFPVLRFNRDAASERLALHMAEEQLRSSSPQGKNISMSEGGAPDDDSSDDSLRKEISVLSQKNIELDIQVAELRAQNIELRTQVSKLQSDRTYLGGQLAEVKRDRKVKDKQISDLQEHFNLLTSSYFELKKKLEDDFGEKYKTSVEEQRINLHMQAYPVDVPAGQPSGSAERIEVVPPMASHIQEIIRKNQEDDTERGQLLFKRNVTQSNSKGESLITSLS